MSSTLLDEMARRITAPQKEETLVTASASVHFKASKVICNAGRARAFVFKTKL